MTQDAPNWTARLSPWILRIIASLMLLIAIGIVSGTPGWEMDFIPPLSERERALVRAGVVFEHGFQIGFWAMALVANELGSIRVRIGAYLTALITMGLCGPYGLQVWLANIGYDPEKMRFGTHASFVMIGLFVVGLVLSVLGARQDARRATP